MGARIFAFVFLGLLLGGCVNATLEPASDANLKPRDKKLLARAPYAKAHIPTPYQRHIVDYPRREMAGSMVIDTDARYLYYVLPGGKAIRYGVTVGEEALVFTGVAKVGHKEEWPSWVPTAEIKKRIPGTPDFVGPGPHNPMGARALYLGETVYRIHGTNQPRTIGYAVSSGCFRLVNRDVIDLFQRVPVGTRVVILQSAKL